MYLCTHKFFWRSGHREEKPQIVFLSRAITPPRWRPRMYRYTLIYVYIYTCVYIPAFPEGRGLMRRGMMEFANHPALHFSPLGSRFSHLRAHLKPHPRFHLYPLVLPPPPLALPFSVVFPSSLILFISLLDISFLPPFVFLSDDIFQTLRLSRFTVTLLFPCFFLSLSSLSPLPFPSSRALVTSSSSTPSSPPPQRP